MKIVAMNCPNCGGKLTINGASKQLVCESCNSLLRVDEDEKHTVNETLNPVQQAKKIELEKMLDRLKQKVAMYRGRGILDPDEVGFIKQHDLKAIRAMSPRNRNAYFLEDQLNTIERMTINGIILDMTLGSDAVLSVINTVNDEVVYSNLLEKVAILSIQEPGLILPGKAVLGTRNDPVGPTITFRYSDGSSTEFNRLVKYISKVAQIPNPE